MLEVLFAMVMEEVPVTGYVAHHITCPRIELRGGCWGAGKYLGLWQGDPHCLVAGADGLHT